jgi:hypothetical protein
MPLPKSFILTWRAWRNAPSPYSNSYKNRHPAPSYNVELVLNHIESYLYGIGDRVIAGNTSNATGIAAQELVRLDQLETELDRLDLNFAHKQQLKTKMMLVRSVWEEIRALPSEDNSNDTSGQPPGRDPSIIDW